MTVLVPIANGTEEMEAVIVIDMLRRAGIDVDVAGAGDVVTCSRGVRIIPDMALHEVSEDDVFGAIVLPGGSEGVEELIRNPYLENILRRHRERKGLVAAICAAPTILHEFRMLAAGATLTSHPSVADQLQQYNYTIDRVAEDGLLITSRGAGTAFEFALSLITRLADATTASRVASDIVLYE
ncbi:MAG: DJ-1 family glyoxalase III [bacterium]|nr:DJ-1 family glyoxalase III [bacterium]